MPSLSSTPSLSSISRYPPYRDADCVFAKANGRGAWPHGNIFGGNIFGGGKDPHQDRENGTRPCDNIFGGRDAGKDPTRERGAENMIRASNDLNSISIVEVKLQSVEFV